MLHGFRRKLIYALAVVLAWLGFVVEGSHALFSDTVSLTQNSVTTGSVDLQISNSQNGSSTLYDDTRPGFALNLNPGESSSRYIFLKNASSSALALDVSVNSVIATSSSAMSSNIQVEFLPVDSTGVANGTPVKSVLSGLGGQPRTLGVSIPPGAAQRFLITVSLDSTYPVPNDSVSYDLIFSGTQHLV